jgi:hypothetical protein
MNPKVDKQWKGRDEGNGLFYVEVSIDIDGHKYALRVEGDHDTTLSAFAKSVLIAERACLRTKELAGE